MKTKDITNKTDIHVDYEYGQLEEVILGISYGRYPDVAKADWSNTGAKILPKSDDKAWIERSGKDFWDIPFGSEIKKENDELLKILKSEGVKVHRPKRVETNQIEANFGARALDDGYIQIFSRDPIVVIGNNVIELAMGTPMRWAGIFGYQDLFEERLPDSGANWIHMPSFDKSRLHDSSGNYSKEAAATLEGGDVIVIGKKILVGNSNNPSVGSSKKGYQWLKNFLAPQSYDVEMVILHDDFLHLDCVISIPRPGLYVACEEAFVNGAPDFFKDWKVIPTSKKHARHLATNGLPINQDTYILGYNDVADGKDITAALEAEGIKVHRLYFGAHNSAGGSVRCATQPLRRVYKK